MFESFNDFTNKDMPLNEGMFSFKTLGDNKAISARSGADIYMFDDKGNMWHEENYEGYGIFGGKDYFELMAEMNGEEGRDIGIDLYYSGNKKVLYPALTRDEDFNWKRHKFTTKVKSDPKQGWFYESVELNEASVTFTADQLDGLHRILVSKMDQNKKIAGIFGYTLNTMLSGYVAKAKSKSNNKMSVKVSDELANAINQLLFNNGKHLSSDDVSYIRSKISNLVTENLNEAKSIAKIQKEWGKVTSIMKDIVAKYKKAEGQEKEDLLDELKSLTAAKKQLEAELDAAVGLKDMDTELAEGSIIDEARGSIELVSELYNELNERTVTLKRRYTENYPAVTAGKSARIRNKMLEAIADGKITQEEFNTILKEMSNHPGKWSRRNAKYFNVSEDGISLSKFGKRALKQITINEDDMNESRENWIVYTGQVMKKFYSEHTSKKSAEKMVDMALRVLNTVGMMSKSEWEKEKKAGNVMENTTFVVESFEAFEAGNLNEASYVVWYEDKDGKHLLGTFHNKRAAEKYKSEEEDEVLNVVGVESIGTMPKTVWDKKEAPYIKEAVISEDFKDVSDKFKNALDDLSDDKFNTKDIEALIKKHKEKRPDAAMAYAKKAFGWLFKESVLTEGKHDEILDKVADAVKDASNFMNVGIALKKAGIKYDFSTGMMPMYKLKQHPIAILNKKYVEKGDREVGDIAIGVLESVNTDNDEMLTEAFKSSKLRNLLTMRGADGRAIKSLARAFYGLTKYKLDELPDAALRDVDPQTAYKSYQKDKEFAVFYIADNEKENPYGDSDWESKIQPGIIGITRGKEFLGATHDTRKMPATLATAASDNAVGGDKRYSGYGATGIYNVKRAAELADRAVVVWLNNDVFKSTDQVKQRSDAKSGAIAFKSDKEFKDANLFRYRQILATKASKLPLDKMVEKAINDLSVQIKDGLANGEFTRYGDILIGKNKKGSDVRMRDASAHMSNILDAYSKYVSYTKEAQEEKDNGYSSGFYEKEAKAYAKRVVDDIKKIKSFDYAW